jgi:hypothetical protein
MTKQRNIAHLLLLPSVYGACMWGVWLALYTARLIPWDDLGATAFALCAAQLAALIGSAWAFSGRARETSPPTRDRRPDAGNRSERTILLVLHAIGLLGVVKYVLDFSNAVGGLAIFGLMLVEAPHRIRWESEMTTSIGTQLSYFGWIAIAWTVAHVRTRALNRNWLALAALQFVANLLFIDRTRPIWILFTAAATLAPTTHSTSIGRALKWTTASALAAAALFVAVGSWIGKIDPNNPYGRTPLPPQLENVYFYGTSGFAYFNHIVRVEHDVEYVPERVLYPLLKGLAAARLTREPPTQINDFYAVPFDTNVGTILEPFYRDGGIPFTLVGILLVSFGFDAFALWLWRQRTFLADFAAANLCFTSFIAFFTPKIASFPLWLFCGLAIAARLYERARWSPARSAS